jgi:hypothetical protein
VPISHPFLVEDIRLYALKPFERQALFHRIGPRRRYGKVRIARSWRLEPRLDPGIVGVTDAREDHVDIGDHLPMHVEEVLAGIVVEDGPALGVERRARGLPAEVFDRLLDIVGIAEPAVAYLMPQPVVQPVFSLGHGLDDRPRKRRVHHEG